MKKIICLVKNVVFLQINIECRKYTGFKLLYNNENINT